MFDSAAALTRPRPARPARPGGLSTGVCHPAGQGWARSSCRTVWQAGPVLAAEHGPDYATEDSTAVTNDDNGDDGDGGDGGGGGGSCGGGSLGRVCHGLAAAAERVRELRHAVPDRDAATGLAVEELDDVLGELKRLEGATTAIRTRLIACAAGAKVHHSAGMSGPDAYLRDRLGLSARDAKKHATTARGLTGMPDAEHALAAGQLGTHQAEQLSRAATTGRLGSPQQTQDTLLETATTATPEQLAETIRRAEQAADPHALRRHENLAYTRRRASCTRRTDGMWQLYALLDPIAGEQTATAIRTHTTPDPPDTPTNHRRSPQQRTADALATMARTALTPNDPTTTTRRRPPQPDITVIIPHTHWPTPTNPTTGRHNATNPATTTNPGANDPDGTNDPGGGADPHANRDGTGPGPGHGATTGSGAAISPQATARLLCDARIRRIVTNARSEILDVGRARRTWSTAQRAAIIVRDQHCRGPGCDRPPDWCHIHHIRWWSHNGPTDLDNGILLCTHHHRLLHEGGWSLHHDPHTGHATFTDPHGRTITTRPRGTPGNPSG